MKRLADRVVLITGSTGIAAATAERAATEGTTVFVVSRMADHLRALAERLDGAGWAAADLGVEAEVEAAVGAVIERFGRIDGCFSVAAGSSRRFGDRPLHTLTGDAWEATAGLNLRTRARDGRQRCAAFTGSTANRLGSTGCSMVLRP